MLPLPRVIAHVRSQLLLGGWALNGGMHTGMHGGGMHAGGMHGEHPHAQCNHESPMRSPVPVPVAGTGATAAGLHAEKRNDEDALMHDLEDRLETEIFRLQAIVRGREDLCHRPRGPRT